LNQQHLTEKEDRRRRERHRQSWDQKKEEVKRDRGQRASGHREAPKQEKPDGCNNGEREKDNASGLTDEQYLLEKKRCRAPGKGCPIWKFGCVAISFLMESGAGRGSF